jgi:hypothetical protein
MKQDECRRRALQTAGSAPGFAEGFETLGPVARSECEDFAEGK